MGLIFFIVAGGALITLTILTRKRAPLLVLEEAAYEAAKKVEAELAEAEVAEQAEQVKEEKNEMKKFLDSMKEAWKQMVCKIKNLFQKQPQETEPEKEEDTESPKEEEENDNGNEN